MGSFHSLTYYFQRESSKASESQTKLKYVMEKERNARMEINSLNKELDQLKFQTEKKILELKREKLEIGDKAQQVGFCL